MLVLDTINTYACRKENRKEQIFIDRAIQTEIVQRETDNHQNFILHTSQTKIHSVDA